MTLRVHGRYDYAPITRRPHFAWPNGTGLAVHVCLGIEAYSFNEGMVEDVMPGGSKPDLANTSWRDYGNRVGGFRLIDLFAQAGVPLAVLLNTACYDQAPDLIDHARAAGCEMVAHGHANSDTLSGMDEATQRAYLATVVARMTEKEGRAPAGWSSPWLAHTDRTIDLLKETGFAYVLDLAMDDQPVWLNTRTEPLLCVPYAIELNDSTAIIGRQTSTSEFTAMIIDQFDELLDVSRTQPVVLSLVVHSFISGQPFRLRALRRAVEHIVARRDQVWLATPGAIAAAFVAVSPGPARPTSR